MVFDHSFSISQYVPALEDMVIGTVTERHAESYKLDIGAAHPATLSATAFEGATKRNRPNILVGPSTLRLDCITFLFHFSIELSLVFSLLFQRTMNQRSSSVCGAMPFAIINICFFLYFSSLFLSKIDQYKSQVGALVFCRVVVADKDMEPEVSCISLTNKHGWMTDQATYGELKDGFMFPCDRQMAEL
jgi:hypothetical protein